MDERQLRDLMDELPRPRASEGFTARTLARLPRRARPGSGLLRRSGPVPGLLRRALWATSAAVLALGLAGGLAVWLATPSSHQRVRQQLAALQDEHNRLAAELQALQTRGAEPELLYLGGTDSIDYLVDLRQLALATPRDTPGRGEVGHTDY